MVTTAAVWQVHSNDSCIAITRVAESSNRASITQNKQHNKQTMTTTLKTMLMRLKLQRTAAAAAAVMARAPSPQANERRMAKETQAETATYREQGRGEIKKLAF